MWPSIVARGAEARGAEARGAEARDARWRLPNWERRHWTHCGVRRLARMPLLAELAVLLAVAMVMLWPAPVTADQMPAAASFSDVMVSHWPFALEIQRAVTRDHRLPLWSPSFGGGLPLAADPLAAMFYPPSWLVYVLSLRNAFLMLFLGHLVFAGLGTVLLGRRALGLRRVPALVAGVAFMATPRLVSHLGAGHLTLIQTVAWYPWLALACWAAVRAPRRWGPALSICVGLTLLAGHPQMAAYGLLMVASMAIWLIIGRGRRGGRREGLRTAGGALAGVGIATVCGVLLAAIQLVPLAELTALSSRQASIGSSDAYPLGAFLLALFGRQRAASSPWETMLTPGLVVLLLAGLGMAARWRRARPLILGVAAVGALAMGHASPLYLVVVRLLPMLDRFRGAARIWFLALLAIALIAGLGAEALLQGRGWPRSLRGARIRGSVLVLVVAGTLVLRELGYAQVGDVRAATTPSALDRAAARLAGDGRIYGAQRNVSQVSAVGLGAALADGRDPLLIAAYARYMARAGGYSAAGYQLTIPETGAPARPSASLLGLLHVSVVLSRTPLTDPRLALIGVVAGTRIYRNTADAGAGYLVAPDRAGGPPSLGQLRRLDVPVRASSSADAAFSGLAFTFATDRPAYFVVATVGYPGWVARLDGRPVPVDLIAGVLPAVAVGPGTHRLTYTYEPESVRLGSWLSALGLAALLVWLASLALTQWPCGRRHLGSARMREPGDRVVVAQTS